MKKTFAIMFLIMFYSGIFAAETAPAPLTVNAENAPAAVTAAAKAVLYGKIMELGTSDPVEGVIIETTSDSAASRTYSKADGSYRVEMEAGKWKLQFSSFGFASMNFYVEIEPAEESEMNVSLDRVDFVSDAVVIRAKKDKNEVIKNTLDRAEIKKIPGTAGDTLRAMQSMPGIAMTGDFSSGLAVQGGGPGDNLYLLDGIPWPFPFHFGGILSTVYSGLLSSVDLNTAGFGVLWGNTKGSVLDAKTRPGDKKKFRADADISLITAQALFETPLGLGDASIAIYGRRSYIDLLFGSMLSYGGVTAVPFFWDTGASLDFTLGSDNHFRAIALANDDIMKVTVDPSSDTYTSFSEGFSMDNAAFTGGISWINTALAGFTSKFTFYYYNLYMKEDAGEYLKMHVAQEDFGLKWEAELNAGEFLWLKHELGFGADVQRVHDGANIYLEYDIVHGTNDPAYVYIDGWHTNRGGYIQDRMNILKGLDLTAGLRYDKNDKVKRDTTMPRFSIAWQSDADTTWKAAWGLYSQFPGDVQLNDVFGNPRLNPETAQHVVAGVERKLTAEITAKLNFYYKYYTDMIVNNKGLVIYENSGTGMAKGAELFVNAKYGEKFFGWISYALSRSDRMSPPVNKWVQYRYDQTHILTAVGSYSFTPAWSLGAKLHYNSGPLVKTFQSAYQDSEGYWHGVFSDDYDRRLEDYLRLDVRTDYTFKFDGWKLNLYVEIINLLNRANPQDIMYNLDYTDTMEIDNLPFMPYIGVEAEF